MYVFDEVTKIYQSYKGEKQIIGKSLYHLPIYCLTVQKSSYPTLIVQGAMHAREHITAHLILRMFEHFLECGIAGRVHFIPIVNPDGVNYCENFNRLYKANGRGVDLNVNFPAKWGKGDKNVLVPGTENYIGEFPLSEPESSCLCSFSLKEKPNMTISYHSKGEEIYWEFGQKGIRRKKHKELAEIAQNLTGYKVKLTKGSCGGYKDWCIQELKIPALTIEVGSDELIHPIGEEFTDAIFEKNRNLLNGIISYFLEKK